LKKRFVREGLEAVLERKAKEKPPRAALFDRTLMDLYAQGPSVGDETPPAVGFAYSPNRRGEHPQAHLKEGQKMEARIPSFS
jgi:hypothetical protein